MNKHVDHEALNTRLRLWSLSTEAMINLLIEEEKLIQNQLVPVQLVPVLDKISGAGMSWTGSSLFVFVSRVIIYENSDHSYKLLLFSVWYFGSCLLKTVDNEWSVPIVYHMTPRRRRWQMRNNNKNVTKTLWQEKDEDVCRSWSGGGRREDWHLEVREFFSGRRRSLEVEEGEDLIHLLPSQTIRI